MGKFLKSRWFLLTLLTLIASGLLIGAMTEPDTVTRIKSFIPSKLCTALTLFLMAFTLDSSQLKAAFRTPGPVIWAIAVNAICMPLAGLCCMRFQIASHFEIGLMIAVSVPSTMAAASVITRKAGANDAVSLLTTLLTNSLCFITTPFWLGQGTGKDISIDPWELSQDLFVLVLVPAMLAQSARLIGPLKQFAVKYKFELSVTAQLLILILVFSSACTGGLELQRSNVSGELLGLAVVWLCCVLIHILGLILGHTGGKLLGFSRKDRIASAFAASQKTLPVGVYLASNPATFGAVPFAVFPILMFHASQLFLDTLIADYFAKENVEPPIQSAAPTAVTSPNTDQPLADGRTDPGTNGR